MKRYSLIIGIFLLGLISCSDFLTVDSVSRKRHGDVFSNKRDIFRALTATYTSLLSNSTYGNAYMTSFALNNDVEFVHNSSDMRRTDGEGLRWFDGTSMARSIDNAWTAAYQGIERANIVINGIEDSPIYDPNDADIMQYLGEAKVLRAMFAHDLVVMCGDIPFTTVNTNESNEFVPPIVDRNEILTFLIEDLQEAGLHMQYASNVTVERVSKDFCYALIARMALTRAGYSLYPDKVDPRAVGTMERPDDYMDYYEVAMNYADSVISWGKHTLAKSFRQVFIDECNYIVNNNDDPIFEIPFLKESSGNVGYAQGPTVDFPGGSVIETVHPWGGSSGGARLNAFYRFTFDSLDLRRDYTVGVVYYDGTGKPQVRADYSTHVNKWSKLWATPANALGASSSGSTGINYPYMRYADVLLMYAEAVNEVENGVSGANGAKAKDALRQVRNRAFAPDDWAEKVDEYIADVSGSRDDFFEAIANERKWEFGGENLRWKDLVRWNLYSKVVYDCFVEYATVGYMSKGPAFPWEDETKEYDHLPFAVFWQEVENPNDINVFPNTTLPIADFYNLYKPGQSNPGKWNVANFFEWDQADDPEYPRAQCLYSFRGYIRHGVDSNVATFDKDNLPPVRYILPIPNKVIQLSQGKYRNYYGY